MVFKIVFQVPYDIDRWDPEVADELRMVTPGDPHGPHIKLSPPVSDSETGESCVQIRCKHASLEEVERLVSIVLEAIPRLINGD